MKIVIYNPQQNTLQVCGEQALVIDLYETSVDEIKSILGKENFIYVTEYLEMNSLSLISMLTDQDLAVSSDTDMQSDEQYLHLTAKHKMYVKYNDKIIPFLGKYDIKNIKDLPQNIIQESSIIATGLKDGRFAIIDEQRKQELLQEQKQEPPRRSKQSIISDTSVKKSLEDSMQGSFDNPIEIDVTNSASFKRNR